MLEFLRKVFFLLIHMVHLIGIDECNLFYCILMFEQSTTEKKESLESELAKVTKDRDLSMKKKDELTGILSQAAQALRSSLVVITVTDYGFGL